MAICSYCKKNYKRPRGLTVFSFDGKTAHYCSSKCRRNLNLGRDPKKVNWVKREKKGRKKDLIDKEALEEQGIGSQSEKKPEKRLLENKDKLTSQATGKKEEKKAEKKEEKKPEKAEKSEKKEEKSEKPEKEKK